MNRLFTSLGIAVMLLASSAPSFAQKNNLSEADKASIRAELLPAVFEQVKEQTGLDIMGLADPQSMAADFAGSPFIKMASSLRSSSTPIELVPDSVILNTSSFASAMQTILGSSITIAFSGYSDDNSMAISTPLPIGGYYFDLNLAPTITVTSGNALLGTLATITIDSQMNDNGGTINVDLSSALLGKGSLLSINIANADASSTIQVVIGDTMKSLLKIMGKTLPDYNYQVNINTATLMTAGTVDVKLAAAATADKTFAQTAPMYDATIGLNLQKMFPSYLDLTEYKNAKVDKFLKMWFGSTQATKQDLVLKADIYAYTSDAKTDSVYTGSDIVTMTNYTAGTSTVKHTALRQYMEQILEDLATGNAIAPYKMTVQQVSAAKDTATILVATATPSQTTKGYAALINIQSFDSANVVKKNYNVLAEADTLGLVKIAATPDAAAAALVTGYFRSNALSVITANETIAASNVKIANGADGFYVSNAARGSYKIIDMKGSIVGNGMITSDYKYIPTSGYAHGVYVIVVNSLSGNATLKFAK